MAKFATFNNIRSIIEANGSIDMSSFMENVLSHNQFGYYVNKSPLGKNGDFITAPEISQMFGEMVGVWVADCWQQGGSLRDVALVELGPGKGTLMADLLRATKHVEGFHESISVYLVEISEPMIQIQKQLFKEYSKIKFHWIKSVNEIPEKPLYLIANEFFDAMPVNQYVKNRDDWYEVAVSLAPETGDFRLMELLLDPKQIQLLNEEYPSATHRSFLESSPISISYIKQIAALIMRNKGAALIIDYGYNEDNSTRKNFNPTIQALKDHKYHPILLDVGHADITAHVDFFALRKAVIERGVFANEISTQRDFLINMGIKLRAQMLLQKADTRQKQEINTALNRLIANDQMGSLFKVLIFKDK
jgi:NADH dehydrogenase [ubiquinone] 1 alpha subcomplex assembly factor 7